jgi:hypothetical protein
MGIVRLLFVLIGSSLMEKLLFLGGWRWRHLDEYCIANGMSVGTNNGSRHDHQRKYFLMLPRLTLLYS